MGQREGMCYGVRKWTTGVQLRTGFCVETRSFASHSRQQNHLAQSHPGMRRKGLRLYAIPTSNRYPTP